MFLKQKYIGSGLGFKIEKVFAKKVEERQNIVIASIWEYNSPSIRLIERLGMVCTGKIRKIYNGKTVYANMYIKFPESLKNVDAAAVNLQEFFITKRIA